MESSVLTVRQAAEYCIVSTETIRRWIKKQDLPAFNTKGKGVIKILKSDLDAFAKQNNLLVNSPENEIGS